LAPSLVQPTFIGKKRLEVASGDHWQADRRVSQLQSAFLGATRVSLFLGEAECRPQVQRDLPKR